ncbi:LuxR C-terminal-related transcriptional regulator [Streptomyces griseoviridis]|uniref:LuxR C-terminal-related transcriptional regulator n=1 Tax=Streptomyces griseoviridis TaxID=45398 RepID=UPI001F0BE25A|nr:LuxR C-terminal-related transcriptional regulator [Streptomyces griseoviridis]
MTPGIETGRAQLEASDQRILHLLYRGLDDASVARHLGVGHRTVQRKVQRLMERLQANGRVALGARAQELGLLDGGEAGAGGAVRSDGGGSTGGNSRAIRG